MGIDQEALEYHKKALEYHKKALKIHEELNNKIEIAMDYRNIGTSLRNMDSDSDEALDYIFKAMEIRENTYDKVE
jgi:tetratricopeptide (TPR) repeat protein